MKRNLYLAIVFASVVLGFSSCKPSEIIPQAINTVNSVTLGELNLERKDYELLNTVTAEASIYENIGMTEIEIGSVDGEFVLKYKKNKFGWYISDCKGIARFGFLSNDYYDESRSLGIIKPEYIARNFAIYRLINMSKVMDADGIVEPIISTNVEQQGKKIIYKTTAQGKLIKLKTNK